MVVHIVLIGYEVKAQNFKSRLFDVTFENSLRRHLEGGKNYIDAVCMRQLPIDESFVQYEHKLTYKGTDRACN